MVRLGWPKGPVLPYQHSTEIRNLLHDGRVSFHVQDPDNPYRTLEVRGIAESMESDPGAVFYRSLQQRYGFEVPVFDAVIRIVIVVAPHSYVAVDGGLTESESVALTELLNNPATDD